MSLFEGFVVYRVFCNKKIMKKTPFKMPVTSRPPVNLTRISRSTGSYEGEMEMERGEEENEKKMKRRKLE